MTGPFRDPVAVKAERAAELCRAIAAAEDELGWLARQIERLSKEHHRRQEEIEPQLARVPNAVGLIVGLLFGTALWCVVGFSLLLRSFGG
jgi:hypothetical protein